MYYLVFVSCLEQYARPLLLERIVSWFIRFSNLGLTSEIQQTQFLEAISAVDVGKGILPIHSSGNRPDPGQRASSKMAPPPGVRLSLEENELVYEAVLTHTLYMPVSPSTVAIKLCQCLSLQ